jgi:uncharacterized protein (TIGR03086 family)
MLDLEPAARRMKSVVDGVGDDQLAGPTPCAGVSVGDLLDHVVTLTRAFRRAADKTSSPSDGPPPEPSAANLPPDWRDLLSRRLDELLAAWQNSAAWQGVTAAGGLELPAPEAGMVALDELVLHGWDLARATGQPYECDPASAEACFTFTSQVPDDPKAREGLFGPVVEVPADAPLFDRVLGLSGRDPAWTP